MTCISGAAAAAARDKGQAKLSIVHPRQQRGFDLLSEISCEDLADVNLLGSQFPANEMSFPIHSPSMSKLASEKLYCNCRLLSKMLR